VTKQQITDVLLTNLLTERSSNQIKYNVSLIKQMTDRNCSLYCKRRREIKIIQSITLTELHSYY